MKIEVQQQAADLGAALSTATVAAYTFTDVLHDVALVVAIISGTLAAGWHVYKFIQEYRNRGNDEDTTDT